MKESHECVGSDHTDSGQAMDEAVVIDLADYSAAARVARAAMGGHPSSLEALESGDRPPLPRRRPEHGVVRNLFTGRIIN